MFLGCFGQPGRYYQIRIDVLRRKIQEKTCLWRSSSTLIVFDILWLERIGTYWNVLEPFESARRKISISRMHWKRWTSPRRCGMGCDAISAGCIWNALICITYSMFKAKGLPLAASQEDARFKAQVHKTCEESLLTNRTMSIARFAPCSGSSIILTKLMTVSLQTRTFLSVGTAFPSFVSWSTL